MNSKKTYTNAKYGSGIFVEGSSNELCSHTIDRIVEHSLRQSQLWHIKWICLQRPVIPVILFPHSLFQIAQTRGVVVDGTSRYGLAQHFAIEAHLALIAIHHHAGGQGRVGRQRGRLLQIRWLV